MRTLSSAVIALALLVLPVAATQRQSQPPPAWAVKELRAGIIGTDTSHVPQFAKIFAAHPEWKVKIVAAFKGGSPDLPISANRVEKFAATIRQDYGVELVDSIDVLLSKVDVVLLTSVDGRPHLAQVTPVLKAGKRVFIDKPLAASLEDVRKIVAVSREARTPFFSSSSLRFQSDLPKMKEPGVGKVLKVQASYVLNKIEFHPDLFYYGIHGVEALYSVMGTGCERLTRTVKGDSDLTTCRWKDGRIGEYRALAKADPTSPLIVVTGSNGGANTVGGGDSEALSRAIAEFFHTGRSPVNTAETVEIFEFMTAAQLSAERNGAEVRLQELRK